MIDTISEGKPGTSVVEDQGADEEIDGVGDGAERDQRADIGPDLQRQARERNEAVERELGKLEEAPSRPADQAVGEAKGTTADGKPIQA